MRLIKTSFLILTAFVFISCGENTQTPVTTDISSIKINETNVTMYSTDDSIRLTANVVYEDGTEVNATNQLTWVNSDYTLINMFLGTILPIANGGDTNISIEYGNLSDYESVHVHKLTEITLHPSDINTTNQTDVITISGSFDNNDSNVSIQRNVTWSTDVNSTILTTTDDNNITLDIHSFPTTITATILGEDFNYTYSGN